MKLKTISLTTILFLLTGCATGYRAQNWKGNDGYSEIRTAQDSFIVTYKGNALTSEEDVLKYSLLRASELTLLNGYKYFVILQTVDRTKTFNEVSFTAQKDSFTGSSGIKILPGTTITIQCYPCKPQDQMSIDAEFYWATNKVN